MSGRTRVVAIVPARNEATRIGRVIETMPAIVGRILVVDDGSSDGTADVARGADARRVELLQHSSPRGVGAAIQSGYQRAVALAAEAAVVVAGDGQMDPRDLEAVVAPILEGHADYVKGNRFAWPDGARSFPTARRLGVTAFSAATRFATRLTIDDAQCGYTAIGRAGLNELLRHELWSSYGYPNDLLSLVAVAKLRVVEVPVRPIFAGQQSKLHAHHLPGVAFIVGRALVRRLLAG